MTADVAWLAHELIARARSSTRLADDIVYGQDPYRLEAFGRAWQQNTVALRDIIADYGWPSYKLVGAEASEAALLLSVQAVDHRYREFCHDLVARSAYRRDTPLHQVECLRAACRAEGAVRSGAVPMAGVQYVHPTIAI